MAGKYSGNLVRTYAAPGDIRNPYPDPAHDVKTRPHEADGSDPYPDAHQVPASQGTEYAGTDFPTDVAVGHAMILDTPAPWEGSGNPHDGPAVLRPVYTDDQARENLAAHSGVGERAVVLDKWGGIPVQGTNEVYDSTVTPGNEIMDGPNQQGAPNILRGINAYPLNNPDREGYVRGVRPGLSRWFTAQAERLMHRREYRYELQPLTDRDIYVPGNQKEPRGDDGTTAPYGPSLPTWLPSWMGPREMRPALWREPPSVDDSLLATAPSGGDSVIGGDL